MGRSILRLTTRCRDVDDFVRAFARQIDKDSLVVRAENPRAVGVKPAFAIALADGTFVMRGRCDVCPLPHGLIRLRFLSLDDAGQAVRDRILGREPEPALPREPLLTVRMAPLFPDEHEPAPDPLAELAPVDVDLFDELPAPVPVPAPVAFARPDTIRPVSVEGPAAAHCHLDTPRPFVPATHKLRTLWRDEDRARVLVLAGAAAIALSITIATATATATATADRSPPPPPPTATATADRSPPPPPPPPPPTVTEPVAVTETVPHPIAPAPVCQLVLRERPRGTTATVTITQPGYKTVRKKLKLRRR